jgi:hypothetical protein
METYAVQMGLIPPDPRPVTPPGPEPTSPVITTQPPASGAGCAISGEPNLTQFKLNYDFPGELNLANCALLETLDLTSLTSLGLLTLAYVPALSSILAPNLTTLGGLTLQTTALTDLNFPHLTTIETATLGQNGPDSSLTTLNFPALTSLDSFSSYDPVSSIHFPTLATATFFGLVNSSLTSISLPALASSSFTATENNLLTAISLPAMATGALNLGANPLLSSLSTPVLATVTGGMSIDGVAASNLNFPALTSSIGDYDIAITNNALLTTLGLPVLATVGRNIVITGCGLLSLSLPALTTVTGYIATTGCASLASLDIPLFVPYDGQYLGFDQCALDAASIERILRSCVLAGVTTCQIDLSGGTNAGLASLSAQGQADAATLGAQLTINP